MYFSTLTFAKECSLKRYFKYAFKFCFQTPYYAIWILDTAFPHYTEWIGRVKEVQQKQSIVYWILNKIVCLCIHNIKHLFVEFPLIHLH